MPPKTPPLSHQALAWWLFACAAMIFAMAVIGAITRLTESGLSIMEWAPIKGALPPMGETEWQRLFNLYQQTDEFRLDNRGMGLAEFKTIFWWEWIHRLWGRIIGLVYVLPLAWFWVRGLLPRWSKPWLLLGLVLGGLQGFVGWFMVHSGFIQGLTDVSQYRLALHLGLALFLYAYVFILGLALLNPDMRGMPRAGCHQRQLILGLVLVSITLISGAFVAGLNAGKLYNEYPLMGQGLVPTEYSELKPWLRNWFDNPAAVQFNHRWLAFATAAVSLWLALFWGLRQATGTARRFYTGLLVLVLCQFGLGIATLLSAVPVWLGALHQAGALLVLLVYCALVYAAFKPRSYL